LAKDKEGSSLYCMKENRMPLLILTAVTVIGLVALYPQEVLAFAQEFQYSKYEPAGFFSGIWHGLLAPWSLIGRWFIDDIVMYAIPNTGWFYDFGFLVGLIGSIPVGWFLAIISLLGHLAF